MNIIKKLFGKTTEPELKTEREWEFNIPFFKSDKWIEIYLYNNVFLSITAKEIYKVEPEDQEDARTFFELGFRVPFRKEVFKDQLDLDLN